VPDEYYGEEIAAWIQLRDGVSATADEIQEFCRAHLAHFKVPKRVRFVTEFLMTITGKLQKFRMQKLETAADPPAT
jgi:fatty-acyl-CoA synthase